MKFKRHYIALLMIAAAAGACRKDNYDPPSADVTGRIVYKGEPINVEYNQVSYQLYQYGFGKTGPIEGFFTQEGNYSMKLFDGEYKFIVPNGQGPFVWRQTPTGAPDTVVINVNGKSNLDVEVTPYYMIRTPNISFAGGKVSASFRIDKIITDASAKDIERVSLYINKTAFVSGNNNIAATDLDGADIADPTNVALEVTVPTMTPSQPYVYARIGLKIAGVEDRLFSPIVKLSL
ncbi:MAG TPA: DUF3823 domain-containing protein [Chitinophaga sp.]